MTFTTKAFQKRFKSIAICFSILFSAQFAQADLIFNGQLCTQDNSDFVKLEIAAENFNQIFSFQFTFNWDPTVLEYHSIGDYNLPHFGGGNYGTVFIDEGMVKPILIGRCPNHP